MESFQGEIPISGEIIRYLKKTYDVYISEDDVRTLLNIINDGYTQRKNIISVLLRIAAETGSAQAKSLADTLKTTDQGMINYLIHVEKNLRSQGVTNNFYSNGDPSLEEIARKAANEKPTQEEKQIIHYIAEEYDIVLSLPELRVLEYLVSQKTSLEKIKIKLYLLGYPFNELPQTLKYHHVKLRDIINAIYQ